MNAEQSPWYLYIIETQGGRLYTGITTDLERRFQQHQSGKGARFFRTDPPQSIVYTEGFSDRSSASRAEYTMKQRTRTAKLALIARARQCPQTASDQNPE